MTIHDLDELIVHEEHWFVWFENSLGLKTEWYTYSSHTYWFEAAGMEA